MAKWIVNATEVNSLMATSEQLRAARALLGLSQPEVADAAGVSSMTVKRAEGSGKPAASTDEMATIQRALEAAGVEFTNGGRPGVRIRKEFKSGDFVKASQVGQVSGISVGRDHTRKVITTMDIVPFDKRK